MLLAKQTNNNAELDESVLNLQVKKQSSLRKTQTLKKERENPFLNVLNKPEGHTIFGATNEFEPYSAEIQKSKFFQTHEPSISADTDPEDYQDYDPNSARQSSGFQSLTKEEMLAHNLADSDDEEEAKSQAKIKKSKTLMELGALVKKRKNEEV